ncbi:MAG: CPBP family intramembrane metalloprotease [Candidatus Methanoperedens sp.]|nr:CPBP family intramembrane metalloprotease [Candidatus Methanoperedens sp.]
MKKEMYLPILGIVVGEMMMFSGQVIIGLSIHIINLLAIILFLTFSNIFSGNKKILQSLVLVLLIRIINFAAPQFFTGDLLMYPLIYGIMFIPIYIIIKNQHISLNEMGIHFKHQSLFFPAALLIGSATAMLEYRILNPSALIQSLQLSNIIFIAIVMFFFVGTVEELMFRSILLTRLEEVFGLKSGLILSGFLFGIMHSVYGLVPEILFAGFFGLVIGYIFQRTRSFLFILTIHGTSNVLLYGILPILLK